jgi:predicted nucleotidyltransferase
MNPEQEYNLVTHLQKKSNGEERITLPLETYDQVVSIITDTLRNAIQSPKNTNGYTKFIIFGSWARRNKKTGPTAESDLDLLVYKKDCGLISLETYRMETLVKTLMHRTKLEKRIHLPEVTLEAEIDQYDLRNIKSGQMSLTKSGYIIVSAK